MSKQRFENPTQNLLHILIELKDTDHQSSGFNAWADVLGCNADTLLFYKRFLRVEELYVSLPSNRKFN